MARRAESTMVLYCLIRQQPAAGEPQRFLLIEKQGHPAFPPTKFRRGEDLYTALVRPMEQDLGLPGGSYYPEKELEAVPRAKASRRYPGLSSKWFLYPVTTSLTQAGWAHLTKMKRRLLWSTVDEILVQSKEPNMHVLANYLRSHPDELEEPPASPSMEALASQWMASQSGGVRVARAADIRVLS